MNRDESGWKRRKVQHQYGVSRCSYGVCKIRLRFHYDSCRQRYDSPRWSYECSRMLTMRSRFDTVLLRFKPVAPRQRQYLLRMCTVSSFHVTGEFGPIHPDSSRTLKNGHDSIHSATKNEPDSATVELRFRPRPQSTTIHPECFKRFEIVVALPGRFPIRQDSPRIITVLLRFMPMFLRCYYESCRCATI